MSNEYFYLAGEMKEAFYHVKKVSCPIHPKIFPLNITVTNFMNWVNGSFLHCYDVLFQQIPKEVSERAIENNLNKTTPMFTRTYFAS